MEINRWRNAFSLENILFLQTIRRIQITFIHSGPCSTVTSSGKCIYVYVRLSRRLLCEKQNTLKFLSFKAVATQPLVCAPFYLLILQSGLPAVFCPTFASTLMVRHQPANAQLTILCILIGTAPVFLLPSNRPSSTYWLVQHQRHSHQSDSTCCYEDSYFVSYCSEEKIFAFFFLFTCRNLTR